MRGRAHLGGESGLTPWDARIEPRSTWTRTNVAAPAELETWMGDAYSNMSCTGAFINHSWSRCGTGGRSDGHGHMHGQAARMRAGMSAQSSSRGIVCVLGVDYSARMP